MKPSPASSLLRLALVTALAIVSGTTWPADARDRGRSGGRRAREEMRFAGEMAEKGLWREALYRWKKVLAVRPDDPRLLNNIAVAEEALGRIEDARRDYRRALELGGARIEPIRTNADLFFSRLEAADDGEDHGPAEPPPDDGGNGARAPR